MKATKNTSMSLITPIIVMASAMLTSCITGGMGGERWRNDCGAFIEKVRGLALAAGGRTFINSDYGVLKRSVTWDMTFKEFKKGTGKGDQLVFDLTAYGIGENDSIHLGFTSDAASPDAWQGMASGTRVKITGIVRNMFFGISPKGGPLALVSVDTVKLLPAAGK